MKKSKKLIVGNWKMNPASTLEAKKIASDIKRGIKNIKKTQVVLCPPYIHIYSIASFKSPFSFIGSQDAFYESVGPFTGEVSFSQLPDFNVSFVIVGHSERRARGETDEIVNKKVKSIVGEGMAAIVCVGEKSRDTHGDYFSFIREQITRALFNINKKSLDHIVIAYEPVWAIGAKEAMTPQLLHEMSIFIKKTLRELFGTLGDDVRILYGGSVNETNAESIVRDGFVQGLLVGRESLRPKNFVEIVRAVDNLK